MAKVVVKGESVYQCDVCNRKTRVPTNKQGLDILLNCNITRGCQGKFHRLTTAKEINSTPAFPPEVEGVQDWFQRQLLYTHNQPVSSTTWTVRHNLNNKPVVHVYLSKLVDGVTTLVQTLTDNITYLDANTLIINFDGPEIGLAQCVSLASQNFTNPSSTSSDITSSTFQLGTDGGELTIATLNSSPLVTIGMTFVTTGQSFNTSIGYAGIDIGASVLSPWVSVNNILVNGKKYTVRSFNITQTPLAPSYFSTGAVGNGAAFYVSTIENVALGAGDALFLLSKSPYDAVDRIYDKVIDVSTISQTVPQSFYSGGTAFVDSKLIKSTYPAIIVV